ncbi:MAG: phosphatidylinositol mannoside acyltransferase [Actinobacteria bacterium HGW-Actinobacteria-4]|nr:MAG: phosphatidylinositol mannoside acyltransferase [Actinobacteria bacterium HGW-Actinobacteria-4]
MTGFLIAWRVSRRLPIGMTRAFAGAAAWIAWALHAKPVKGLEFNLNRVTKLEGKQLRRLSRRGMASAARYYAEVLELPRLTEANIDARVRVVNPDKPLAAIARDGRIVVALSHSGNWDLTGAWATRGIAPVTSVAEVLEPRAVFDEFMGYRESLGMRILGHEGSSTFRSLISVTKEHGGVLALVADRDMSGSGIEVEMWGHAVRVAPGPAALAATTKTELYGLMVHYEQLTRARRKVAKSKWGIVMTFSEPIEVPAGTTREQAEVMTRAWSSFVAEQIALHPQDWHMLQRFGWVS